MLAIKASLAPLQSNLLFSSLQADSSNTSLVTATATSSATPGTQRIRVQQMATTQELVTGGVSDPAHTPLGAGTVVLASMLSRLSQGTSLAFLNNQQGVNAGTIQITDRSGAGAQVDLSGAQTVQDVLDAINSATGIHVQASVQGDGLVIQDTSGQQTSALTIADVNGGRTARDLGIAGTNAGGTITGANVNKISESTALSLLNDGNGIGIDGLADDMQITTTDNTTGDKKSFNVNLSDRFTGTANLTMLNGGLGVRLGTVQITHADGTISQVDLSGAKTVATS